MSRAICPLIILSQKSGRKSGSKKSRMKSNQICQQQPSKIHRLQIYSSSYLIKYIFRDRLGNVRISMSEERNITAGNARIISPARSATKAQPPATLVIIRKSTGQKWADSNQLCNEHHLKARKFVSGGYTWH
jgi:hypothetical protein